MVRNILLRTEANQDALMKAKKAFDPKNKLLTPREFEKISQNN
ncbi:hypothetical protein [Lactobacillus johnsonii]|nr:hypothetical protein [Lactobacillus johnsonii]